MEIESLDVLIFLALVVGLVRGLATGAVRQVVSFLGTIVALVLGLELMNPVGRLLGRALGIGETLHSVIGFIAVFVAIQIALIFGVRIVEAAIKMFRMTPLNRLAGGVVGACKAALILSVLFVVLGFFDVPEAENRNQSVLYSPVASVFPAAWNYAARHLPRMRNLSDRFGKQVEGVLTDYSD